VPTYGILYFAGIILHFVLSWRIAKRYGLRRRVWIAASVCYLLGMTVGAKLLFDVRHPPFDLAALLQFEHYRAGGLWGGLLAYFALAGPAVLLLSRRRLAALDLIAETVPVPWIAAKLGCLFNGCCYGRPCTLAWAITFPEGARAAPAGVPVHPTQLYEVGLLLIVLLVFAKLKSDRWRGARLLWFLVIYGVGRAATDVFRGDTQGHLLLGRVSLTQLLCLVTAVGALLALSLRFVGPICRAQRCPDDKS
jgi:phosphatidylglycerol:prolipoprotein diacylglycerol transferase